MLAAVVSKTSILMLSPGSKEDLPCLWTVYPVVSVDAISMVNGKAHIDAGACYGCAECTATCRFGRLVSTGKGLARHYRKKMAEYAWGAVKDKLNKVACFSFLIHVTKDCDCVGRAQSAVIRDIGILASAYDPVAIDQATRWIFWV